MKTVFMFIDDDDAYLHLLERVVQRLPELADPMLARDGVEALQLIETHLSTNAQLPNVMFVDINMPRMDGFMFLERFADLKKSHTELEAVRPVVMLTSSAQDRDKEKARKLGADEYVVKPSMLDEFADVLKSYCA